MARSRSRSQGFLGKHPRIFFIGLIVLALLLVAGMSIVARSIFGVSNPSAQKPAPQPSSQAPNPVATPSASASAVGVTPESGDEDTSATTDCSVVMSKSEYDSLMAQVLAYQTAFVDPHGPNSAATIASLATQAYIQTHTKTVDPSTDDPNQRTAFNSYQGTTCSIASSSSVIVQTISDVTNYENQNGVATDQVPLTLSITMGWVKQNGQWHVNTEDG